MTKEWFEDTNFRQDSKNLIEICNGIIDDFLGQSLRLTLRQLYYQCVVRNLFPNSERSYKNLGNLVSNGRLAGIIDWEAIEDRVRQPREPQEFKNLAELVDVALRAYRLPRWKGQSKYVELWVEKDALAGVLMPMAREFHVTLMVNRGYSSQSAMYDASKRFLLHTNLPPNCQSLATVEGIEKGVYREAILFYLGDLDPSGEDMVRDIHDRLKMFGIQVEIRKLALTMEQVKKYNPPPNPAKQTDPRASGFIEKFGSSSWEVDALPPDVLQKIIRHAFKEVIDRYLMDRVIAKEEKDKNLLRKALNEKGVKFE